MKTAKIDLKQDIKKYKDASKAVNQTIEKIQMQETTSPIMGVYQHRTVLPNEADFGSGPNSPIRSYTDSESP